MFKCRMCITLRTYCLLYFFLKSEFMYMSMGLWKQCTVSTLFVYRKAFFHLFLIFYFPPVWRRSTIRFFFFFFFFLSVEKDIALELFEWGWCSFVRTFSSQTLLHTEYKISKTGFGTIGRAFKRYFLFPISLKCFIKFLKLSNFPFKLHSFFWFLGPNSRPI